MKLILPVFFLAFSVLCSPLAAEEQSSPVVIEVFTSQGCSSCPPADGLVAGWGMNGFKKGEILPLCFHVDYWDRLGWQDPFSSREFTARQERYAAVLGSRNLYTPQMVVAGSSGFVGSDAGRAATETDRLGGAPAMAAEITPAWSAEGLSLTVTLPAGSTLPAGELELAVFENGLVTRIERGENSGLSLRNDFVVRRFETLGRYAPGEAFSKTVNFSWPAEWRGDQSGAALLLQDPESMKIHAAASRFPLK